MAPGRGGGSGVGERTIWPDELPATGGNWLRALLYYPVAKGYWRQHEFWDGTYTVTDCFEILEVIAKEEAEKIELQVKLAALKAMP